MLGNGERVSRILVLDSPGRRVVNSVLQLFELRNRITSTSGHFADGPLNRSGGIGEEKVVISSDNKPSVFHTAASEH